MSCRQEAERSSTFGPSRKIERPSASWPVMMRRTGSTVVVVPFAVFGLIAGNYDFPSDGGCVSMASSREAIRSALLHWNADQAARAPGSNAQGQATR